SLGCATAALAGDGEGRAARRAALREKIREAVQNRRQRVMEFLASLQVTDDQRRVVLEKAKAAAPIVAGAKDEARRIVAQALANATRAGRVDRKAARLAVGAELKALRERTRAQLEPLAKDVVGSLTPEQKQKLQEAATKRGRTLDDAKLARFAT